MKDMVYWKNEILKNGLKYHIITYGCQMNEHESEKIAGILEELGYRPAQEKEEADFILFNTCCVRENAEQKTFGNVGKIKKLKEENKNLIVAVCGCMTQQEEVAHKLSKTFPFVDIIFGTHNIHELSGMLLERLSEKQRVLRVQQSDGQVHEAVPLKRGQGPAASVNIMYGCNNYCSYCIVPYVRGAERSRDADDVLGEVKELEIQGYQEIMLLGQNVNSYNGKGINFSQLLNQICTETKIPRIRFMTSHPKDLSDELIETIAKHPQICRHIHLPVQSGSTKVLERMNRKYTRSEYLSLVNKIRRAVPGIAITTDIIVGFPGETEQDFEDTLSLVRKVRFDAAFTFVYSVRSGTAAAKMADMVDETTKRERIVRLVALQNEITEQRNKEYEGQTVCVLVEGQSARNTQHVCGKSGSFKMVNFEGDPSMIGTFQEVLITQGKKTTLFGTAVRK